MSHPFRLTGLSTHALYALAVVLIALTAITLTEGP